MSRKLSTNNNISASCKEGSFPSCFPWSLPLSHPAGTVPALLVPHPRLLQPYSPTRQPDPPRCSRLTLFSSLEKRYSAFLWDSLLDFLLQAVSANKDRAEKPLPSAPGTLDPSPITRWHRTRGLPPHPQLSPARGASAGLRRARLRVPSPHPLPKHWPEHGGVTAIRTAADYLFIHSFRTGKRPKPALKKIPPQDTSPSRGCRDSPLWEQKGTLCSRTPHKERTGNFMGAKTMA